ncbi:NUDIX hydrolase [[Clostridium] polysaccharolyticum]|uniref:ADP-ribose pyrophosphatase n=1 Tax=[Clostridium] polysaccharolyticum TaxID=29364 RepID=A0A1I0ABR9_9FIRM|nr:NUDIX hydrolase [[Clostridium] polysaccharolyticum]SES91674.1 ADP-ribose pyrophosphatase [[Clostridium] polysaccharolyticum]
MEEMKRVKRNLVHKGRIIDVYQDDILTPAGDTVTYDIVEHKGASSMVALDENGKVLMVRQYRTAIQKESLELPAGGINPGEDTKTCAMRELEEETGYRPLEAHHLLDVYTSVGFCNEKIYIYYTDSLVSSRQNLDEDEFVHVERYAIEELVKMIEQGKIEDSKTVAGILAYKNKMGL